MAAGGAGDVLERSADFVTFECPIKYCMEVRQLQMDGLINDACGLNGKVSASMVDAIQCRSVLVSTHLSDVKNQPNPRGTGLDRSLPGSNRCI